MFTEEQLENTVIEYFQELGYHYLPAHRLQRDEREVLLLDRLEQAITKLNPDISNDVLQQVMLKLRHFDTNDVFTNNKVFHQYLTENVEIAEFIEGETVYHRIRLIDWELP